MKNYYEYEVRSAENGFIIEALYKDANASEYNQYQADRFIFVTFAEVLDFMTKNPLISPPIKN